MLFSPSVILEKIKNDFGTVNQSFSGFPGSGSLWDECVRTVKDPTLMNHIIFNNDVMEIPPMRTFLKANRVLEGGFTNYQKKALDAFWGFVFKDIFFYATQEDNARVDVLGIRKAARYTNPQSDVMVGDLDEATGKIVIPTPRQRLRRNLSEPGGAVLNPVSEDQRIDNQGFGDKRMDDHTIGNPRVGDQRFEDQRFEDQRIADQRIEDPRFDNQRVENQRTEDQRIDGQRLEGQRLEGQRTEGHRIEGQRNGNQRFSEPRLEEQRLEEHIGEELRNEEPRLEERRLEEQIQEELRNEEPRLEERRLEEQIQEELKNEEPRV